MTNDGSDIAAPASILLYQTEDGQTRIACRLEEETLWLSQAQMAELFQTTPQNITLHLKAIYERRGSKTRRQLVRNTYKFEVREIVQFFVM